MKGRPSGGRREGSRPGITQRQPALARLEARLEAWAERTEGTRRQQVIEQLGKLMFGDEWHGIAPAAGGPSPGAGSSRSTVPGAGSIRPAERRPGPDEGGRGE